MEQEKAEKLESWPGEKEQKRGVGEKTSESQAASDSKLERADNTSDYITRQQRQKLTERPLQHPQERGNDHLILFGVHISSPVHSFQAELWRRYTYEWKHMSSASIITHMNHLRPASVLLFRGRRKHHHILSLAASKLQNIFIPELKVPRRLNPLAVQLRAIARFQVDNVGLDLARLLLHAVLVLDRLLDVPELNHGMLPAAARMLQHVVDDLARAAEQPAAARVQLDGVGHVFAFEHEHAPLLRRRRFARLGRLMVLQADLGPLDLVGGLG